MTHAPACMLSWPPAGVIHARNSEYTTVGEKIRFEKHFQQCSFHNPMLEGKLDTQELEIRKDPLSGRQSIYNPGLKDKVKILFPATDAALIQRLASESAPQCFLCGDRWRQATPAYPAALVPGGRVQVGESILFPNLFPLSQMHAVIRVGSRHYLPLTEFTPRPIEEAFRAAGEFVGCLARSAPTVRFVTLNGNYLAPAGASIVHPHFQLLAGDVPFTHLQELLSPSAGYQREHHSCYWTDLVAKEQQLGVRTIATTGAVDWIASFSPQGSNEVLGILTARKSFLELTAQDFADLAAGFSSVLRGYGAMGFSTFNFTLYSGPLGAADEGFRCFLRVISRQNVYENYRTDDYFLQKLLRNEIMLTTPESLASTLREFL